MTDLLFALTQAHEATRRIYEESSANIFGTYTADPADMKAINKATIMLARYADDEQVRPALLGLEGTDHEYYGAKIIEAQELIAAEDDSTPTFLLAPRYDSATEESQFLLIFRELEDQVPAEVQ